MNLNDRFLVRIKKIQKLSRGHWDLIMSERGKFIKSEMGRTPVLLPGVLKKGIGKSKKIRYTSLGHRTRGERKETGGRRR